MTSGRMSMTWIWILALLLGQGWMMAQVQGGQNSRLTGGEEVPATVTFMNRSSRVVIVHLTAFDAIQATHPVNAGQELTIQVPFGNIIRVEYAVAPFQTTLSPIGSVNELERSVTITDQGENLFLNETFSGQRHPGKGENRRKWETVSDPDQDRLSNNPGTVSPGGASNSGVSGQTRKEDPNRSAPKSPVTGKKKKAKLGLDKKNDGS